MSSTAPNPFDDGITLQPTANSSNNTTKQKADRRAERRRQEAVSRLVVDATRPPDFLLEETTIAAADKDRKDDEYSNLHALETIKLEAKLRSQQHSTLLLASTVASSIERGLDRELHTELLKQGKDAQNVISKICHDHSEDFLESVGKVVAALCGPCEEVKSSLNEVRSLL